MLSVALIIVTGVIIVMPKRIDYSSYLAAIIDKQERLERLPSPKIIFVGGSNLVFNIDSRRIEAEFARPVANMGVHVSLGLRFMLNQIRSCIGRGDIVIVLPEYEQFYYSFDGDGVYLLHSFVIFPRGIKFLNSARQFIDSFKDIPVFIKGRFEALTKKKRGSIYNRYAFNEYGEIEVPESVASRKEVNEELFEKPIDDYLFEDEAIGVLNEFARYVSEHGAEIYIVFPCVPEKWYARNRKIIMNIYKRLHNDCGIPILFDPRSCVLPQKCFFDSMYHLNQSGRKLNTEKLIATLKGVMQLKR